MKKLLLPILSLIIIISSPKSVFAVQCGINIDPANPGGHPSAAAIAGAQWVRIEYKDCSPQNPPTDSVEIFKQVLQEYKSANINTLVILDYLTYPGAKDDPEGFAQRTTFIDQELGDLIDAYEIWNEPDLTGTFLSEQEFADIVNAVAPTLSGNIILGGFASGDLSYFERTISQITTNYTAIGVHPYGRQIGGFPAGGFGEMSTLINQYKSAGKPIWITEIGINTSDEAVAAQYMERVYSRNIGADVIIWFAWSDAMVPPFGITTESQSPKLSYDVFFTACGSSSPQTSGSVPAISPPGGQACGGGGATPEGPPEPFDLDKYLCSQTTGNKDEFHSLRPYPASACLDEVSETALFCGNDLITKDTLQGVPQPKDRGGDCIIEDTPEHPFDSNWRPGSYIRCTFDFENLKTPVRIDLSDSEFPIAGNTELVPNSTNPIDQFTSGLTSFAQRMTEYVSWYLNGVVFRAEEPPVDEMVDEYASILNRQPEVEQPSPTTTPTPTAGGKILAIGDSITAGQIYPSWACYLREYLDESFSFVGGFTATNPEEKCGDDGIAVEAIPGWTTQLMLAQINGWSALAPDIAIIHLGTNDVDDDYITPELTRSFLSTMINALKQANPNVRIYLSQIIPFRTSNPPKLTEINNQIASLAGDNVSIVDMYNTFKNSPEFSELYRIEGGGFDSAHPGKLGAQVMAGVFAQAVLGGSTQPGEETPEKQLANQLVGRDPLVNFSGPLRKLLPKELQIEFKKNEEARIGEERHNQIVSCGPLNNPRPCYTNELSLIHRLRPVSRRENSEAFQYIPYSSTEDRIGESLLHTDEGILQFVDDEGNSYLTSIQPLEGQEGQGVEISSVKFIEIDENPDDYRTRDELYFAHTQENVELANILQGTFAPQGEPGFSGGLGYQTIEEIEILENAGEIPQRCEIVDTRSNPGDDLYGEEDFNREGVIRGDLTFDAKYSCEYAINGEKYDQCRDDGGSEDDCMWEQLEKSPPCEKPAIVAMTVFTKTPKAEEMWERFVGGSFSIFKRMFPQVGPGAPVEEIEDLPGVTTANYTSGAEQTLAGDPQGSRPGSSAQLFFPHLGSIYDYFLQGIQKALNPLTTAVAIGPGLPSTSPAPSECTVCIDLSEQKARRSTPFVNQMAARYNVPAGFLDAIWAIETGKGLSNTNCPCVDNDACGPMAITKTAYDYVVSPSESLDRCDLQDAMEIAARTLLHKKYCTLLSTQYCANFLDNPENPVPGGFVGVDELKIAGRYYGVDSCQPDQHTQSRTGWGPGCSYCDAVEDYINGCQ